MVIEDLEPYSYGTAVTTRKILAVGWLGRASPFARSTPSPEFLEALASVTISGGSTRFQFGQTRGFHHCELCKPIDDPDADLEAWLYQGTELIAAKGASMRLGSCEILVPCARNEGIYFVAPSLVYHYIRAHGYAPPTEFVDAVMAASRLSKFNAEDVVRRFLGSQQLD